MSPLVIPRRHVDHFIDFPEKTAANMMVVAHGLGRVLTRELQPLRVGYVVSGCATAPEPPTRGPLAAAEGPRLPCGPHGTSGKPRQTWGAWRALDGAPEVVRTGTRFGRHGMAMKADGEAAPLVQRAGSLDEQHAEFVRRKFLAVPIAGAVAWTGIGVAGALLPPRGAVWAIFIGTGMIFYLGLLVARFTGEDLLGKERKGGNFFDRIFLLSVVMAVLVYSIAVPFFLVEPTSLPLSVGILTGLMWVPFSGLIEHRVGLFHAFARTAGILVVHYSFPGDRFVAVPAVIVGVYLVTIIVLASRHAELVGKRAGSAAA